MLGLDPTGRHLQSDPVAIDRAVYALKETNGIVEEATEEEGQAEGEEGENEADSDGGEAEAESGEEGGAKDDL